MLSIFPYVSRRPFASTGRPGGINYDYTFTVKTEAIGKSPWRESPYLLANEWISANLAQFLRLPIPPFAIVRKKSRHTKMIISYSFDGDTKPDDVEPQLLYNAFPELCTGVVVFDIFIANCDRNCTNLQVDNPSRPTAFYLFDHERALFYIYAKEGIKRLESREDRLGVTDGSTSADEWHCLVELLDNAEYIAKWVGRIQSLPDWFIDDICDEMLTVSINSAECKAVKSFLKRRRNKLDSLILTHKNRFPLIHDWQLLR